MAEDLPDLFFLLAGAASAALVFTIYHVSAWCNRSITSTAAPAGPQQLDRPLTYEDGATPAGCVEITMVRKYENDMELVGDDRMCVVCLSEFEEGEELRTLPHCMHSFHVPCIDMWLNSHMNCPLCRLPSSLMFLETQQDLRISSTNNIAA